MTRRTLLITWLVITALCSLFAYILCCSSGAATSENAYVVEGGDGFSAECGYGRFVKSGYQLLHDLEPDCHVPIAEHLKSHPDQNLNIEGHYTVQEENNSIYENLGLARAAQVKQEFISQYGVSENQLSTTGKLVDDDALVNDTLHRGYLLTLGSKHTSDDDTSRLNEEIILHFNTGSQEPNVDETIRHQFSTLLTDLDAHPEAHIMITGHTDSQGDAESNKTLGMQRAEQVKHYLIKNGIDSIRISTQSMGETKPISDDDAENRRVTVIIN